MTDNHTPAQPGFRRCDKCGSTYDLALTDRCSHCHTLRRKKQRKKMRKKQAKSALTQETKS